MTQCVVHYYVIIIDRHPRKTIIKQELKVTKQELTSFNCNRSKAGCLRSSQGVGLKIKEKHNYGSFKSFKNHKIVRS